MSKTEIIAELARLSPDDLAEVRAWFDRLTLDNSVSSSNANGRETTHVRSPRLLNPGQSVDFIKQVTELPADAAL